MIGLVAVTIHSKQCLECEHFFSQGGVDEEAVANAIYRKYFKRLTAIDSTAHKIMHCYLAV